MPKAKKLAIEDEVGGDYLGRLREAGRRTGESRIAFGMRIANLQKGREMVTARCEATGDVSAALTQLGVKHNNHAAMIRKLGFLREELEATARSGGRVGLPAIR